MRLDSEQIRRVIINLVDNAIEAMERRGHIVIETQRASGACDGRATTDRYSRQSFRHADCAARASKNGVAAVGVQSHFALHQVIQGWLVARCEKDRAY